MAMSARRARAGAYSVRNKRRADGDGHTEDHGDDGDDDGAVHLRQCAEVVRLVDGAIAGGREVAERPWPERREAPQEEEEADEEQDDERP